MGKGKSRMSKLVPRKKLVTAFTCPFCDHPWIVECVMARQVEGKEVWIGTAQCYGCGASYSTKIHSLPEPIDIYTEWIDEYERANSTT